MSMHVGQAAVAYMRICELMGCDCEDPNVCESEYLPFLLLPLDEAEATEQDLSGEIRLGNIMTKQPFTKRGLNTTLIRLGTLKVTAPEY